MVEGKRQSTVGGRGAMIENVPGCQDGGVAAWSRHRQDGGCVSVMPGAGGPRFRVTRVLH